MDIFVARQPIFDSKQNVFAYELLFRSGFKNVYDSIDGDKATSSVLDNSFFSIGMNTLTRSKPGFVNFTRNLLLNETATIFPKDLMAVEILETVEPQPDIINSCRNLKQKGYMLVLDDFVFDPKYQQLIELADIIKIDFLNTPTEDRKQLIHKINSNHVKYLAEKVETKEDFEQGLDFGYSYFQGYFFSKPDIVSGKALEGYKIFYLQILQELNKPETDFSKIEEIIKQDVSLSYKLLKFINSAAFGFLKKIESIKQALVLLGFTEVRKWLSLVALTSLGKNKPEELLISSFMRATFFEQISHKIGLKDRRTDLFLMGIFSMIDGLIDKPKAEILAELPLADDIRAALLGKQNNLREVYELLIDYEEGHWEKFTEHCSNLGIDEKIVPNIYMNSVEKATDIFQN